MQYVISFSILLMLHLNFKKSFLPISRLLRWFGVPMFCPTAQPSVHRTGYRRSRRRRSQVRQSNFYSMLPYYLRFGSPSMLAPLYMAEISPPEVRGSLMALEQFSIVLGVVLGFWIGFLTRNSELFPSSLMSRHNLGFVM